MSVLQDCRNQVRNDFGAATEQKCSDSFALRHGRTRSGNVAKSGERAATILELEPIDEGKRASTEALARRLKVLTDVLKETGEPYAGLAAASLLRQHELERARQAFFDRAYDIIGALEKASRGISGAADQIAEREAPLRSIDGCWLNETIRTPAHAVTDAGLQEDPRIQYIDTPRRLRPEINKTGPLVGATDYRAAHNVNGEGVIVAVIDTEIHRDHPSLVGRVVRKRNYTTEDWEAPGGNPQAPHGTAVAGIIGSSAGPPGIAPAITFFNYKVLPSDEAFPPGDDFDGALAIQHAMHDGVHIANCSWKAVPNSNVILNGKSREARACNRAWRHGVVVVTSVGNDGPGVSTLTSPSDADGVIAVGATDRRGSHVPDYSSRGPTAHGLQRPHLLAPGGDDGNQQLNSCTIFDEFRQAWRGTSFAAAHVSGLVALLLGRDPTLTPDQVRDQLLGMCTPLAGLDANTQGLGLIHIK